MQLYVANKMSLAMQQPYNTFYETGTAAEVGGCKYATNPLMMRVLVNILAQNRVI